MVIYDKHVAKFTADTGFMRGENIYLFYCEMKVSLFSMQRLLLRYLLKEIMVS